MPARLTARVVSCLALLLPLVVSSSADAQTAQPVYPVYDGFARTDEGPVVLSFAYFNHNREAVMIPAGPDNAFSPDAADRQHTTTFLPGHQRFQCIMLVDAAFDGGLRWRLSYADTETSTSADMLQYNWELDASGTRQAMRDIDVASAPRGVCLNRPPLVRLLGLRGGPEGAPPEVTLSRADQLQLFGSVQDEGLPRDAGVTTAWRQVSGPGTTRFRDPSVARTIASFDVAGTYELELWASDSELEATTQLRVVVTP
jgi:hypothetical protein